MQNNQKIRIGGATINQTPIDWEGNKQRIIYAIEYGRLNEVELLALPEMCITGYGCEDLFLSEWLYETALEKLLELLPYCYDISVCLGLPVLHNHKRYNCTCLIKNTIIQGFYVKQFLANDGIFYEKRWFSEWHKKGEYQYFTIDKLNEKFPFGDVIFDLTFSNNINYKIGFEICEDAWQTKDRPAFLHQKRGAEIIINPSASNFEFGKTKRRELLVTESSKKFDCTYIYANLLGNEAGKIIFDGEVLIAQKGNLIAKNELLSFQDFNVVFADIDLKNHHLTISKCLVNQILSKEIEFRDAVTLALFDYMRKSKSQGFVLSLSGGADSSCCAIMVAEMVRKGVLELGKNYFMKKSGVNLTPENNEILSSFLITVYQQTENSSLQTLQSAKELANAIRAIFYEWNIDEPLKNNIDIVSHSLGKKLTWQTDDLALQNIQARVRSPLIWMLANIKNALLITTSNRSEGDVGYCTMDGDTSGSISPIAGVDKSFIKHWLIWAEKELKYGALCYVNNLQPSAELRPLETFQTDEKDLMPYTILNQIELLAIRNWKSPSEVYLILKKAKLIDNQLLKKYIKRFFQLWARSQWKRERYAPAFHLDLHNIDSRSWCRFPILNSGFEHELKKLDKLI